MKGSPLILTELLLYIIVLLLLGNKFEIIFPSPTLFCSLQCCHNIHANTVRRCHVKEKALPLRGSCPAFLFFFFSAQVLLLLSPFPLPHFSQVHHLSPLKPNLARVRICQCWDPSSQPPIDMILGSQFSKFSSHNGLEAIDHNDEETDFGGKEHKKMWLWEEDKLLINAWLNVSMNVVVGTDQPGGAFWNRIRDHCEESNPGLIKRGAVAMKKRWHLINKFAKKFGGFYDQASRRIASGSNDNDIMELAHQLFEATEGKKCNFVRHWNKLRRERKWRSQSTESGGSKRTKISASGAYSSSTNSETLGVEEVGVDSPIRCPQGTKTSMTKGKGKSKACDGNKVIEEELVAIRGIRAKKLSYMEERMKIEKRKLEQRQQYLAIKEMAEDRRIIVADTSVMNEEQRLIHAKMVAKIKAKYV